MRDKRGNIATPNESYRWGKLRKPDEKYYRAFGLESSAGAVFEDVCTHDGGILTGGTVEGAEVMCPRHGARFSIISGEALSPPAYEPVPTFPARVEQGMVQVRDDRWG